MLDLSDEAAEWEPLIAQADEFAAGQWAEVQPAEDAFWAKYNEWQGCQEGSAPQGYQPQDTGVLAAILYEE